MRTSSEDTSLRSDMIVAADYLNVLSSDLFEGWPVVTSKTITARVLQSNRQIFLKHPRLQNRRGASPSNIRMISAKEVVRSAFFNVFEFEHDALGSRGFNPMELSRHLDSSIKNKTERRQTRAMIYALLRVAAKYPASGYNAGIYLHYADQFAKNQQWGLGLTDAELAQLKDREPIQTFAVGARPAVVTAAGKIELAVR